MNISLLKMESKDRVYQFYRDITEDLRKKGINQWDRFYPNAFIIKSDIKDGNMFGIIENQQVIGTIVLDTKESKKYRHLQWEDHTGKPLVIHRLGVHPLRQGKGYGKLLLQFAEDFAKKNGYSSIRLDVYSSNKGALKMYERNGYKEIGSIKFPFRSVPYYCYEKVL